jgi:hypothetical protein
MSKRSQITRALKFSNIGLIWEPQEGVQGAHFMVCSWNISKMNQFGRVQQVAILRHKNPSQCAISAVGFMWLLRFQDPVKPQPWPDFTERPHWYL